MSAFLKYQLCLLRITFNDFRKWWLDLIIATVIAALTTGIQLHWNIIPANQSRPYWFSVLGPYVLTFGIHIAWRRFLAPWKKDGERQKEIDTQKAELAAKDAEIATYRTSLAKVERKLHDSRPQLNVLVMADEARKWNEGQRPFGIQNSGQRPARYIDIVPIQSETGKYILHLNVVHRELLMPNARTEIMFEVFEQTKYPQPQRIIDAMKDNIKMLQLFFKEGSSKTVRYPLQIICQDTETSLCLTICFLSVNGHR